MRIATFSKEQLLRLKVATCLEMADQAAFRAVEQVLTGAVSKVLSKFQPQGATAKSSRGNTHLHLTFDTG